MIIMHDSSWNNGEVGRAGGREQQSGQQDLQRPAGTVAAMASVCVIGRCMVGWECAGGTRGQRGGGRGWNGKEQVATRNYVNHSPTPAHELLPLADPLPLRLRHQPPSPSNCVHHPPPWRLRLHRRLSTSTRAASPTSPASSER